MAEHRGIEERIQAGGRQRVAQQVRGRGRGRGRGLCGVRPPPPPPPPPHPKNEQNRPGRLTH